MYNRYADGGVASSSPRDAFTQIKDQNNPPPPAPVMAMPVAGDSNQAATPPAIPGAPVLPNPPPTFRKGGKVTKKPTKKFAAGGSVSGASKRGDGCATKGKTKGTMR